MTEKIEEEIKIKAEQVTDNLVSFMKELDTEANKQIKELEYDIGYYKSKIAELEKENTELKENIENIYANHCNNCNRNILNTSLKKENTELKEQHRKDLVQIQAILNQRSLQNTKLTKAKKIIKTSLRLWNGVMTEDTVKALIAEAEQFLKG